MKRKHWLLYVVFGLVLYLLFLIVELPASWFAWGLNRYTQGTVRLDPIAGTLWSGNGRLVLYHPKTTPHDLGQTAWRINPLWLVIGRVQVSLQTTSQEKQIKATFGISRNRYAIKNAEAVMPAALVAQFYPPASLIGPVGNLRFSASELAMESGNLEGTGILEWQNAGSSLSEVRPLGDYRLNIEGTGNIANIKLSTLQGDLGLSGQGRWQLSDARIMFTGEAVATKRENELQPLLQQIGNETEPGRRSFSISWQLPR